MTTQRPHHKRLLLTKPLSVLLLFALIQLGLPRTIYAKGPRPLEGVRNLSLLSVRQDDELTRLKKAVSAALDDIETLKKQLAAADAAVASLNKAVESAEKALASGKIEREAYDRTIALQDSAIKQQQSIIATYEGAIKTLTTLVDMTMKRVTELERKVDKANGRTATLGIILTVAGVLIGLRR